MGVSFLRRDGGRIAYEDLGGSGPLVVCAPGAKSAVAFHSDGIALGFDKGPVFDRTIQDAEHTIEPGERIVMCTRTLFEGKTADGKEVGEGYVYRLFAKEAARDTERFLPQVFGSLDRVTDPPLSSTPLTALTLRRLA